MIEKILVILCVVSIIPISIFFVRKNNKKVDYSNLITLLNNQKEIDLKIIEDGNKEILEIEKKIYDCKKKLNMKLFK